MLIPTRTKASFNSYSDYQRKQEEYLTLFLAIILAKRKIIIAGPRFSPLKFYEVEVFAPKEVLTDQEEVKRYCLKIVQWQIEGLTWGQKVKI